MKNQNLPQLKINFSNVSELGLVGQENAVKILKENVSKKIENILAENSESSIDKVVSENKEISINNASETRSKIASIRENPIKQILDLHLSALKKEYSEEKINELIWQDILGYDLAEEQVDKLKIKEADKLNRKIIEDLFDTVLKKENKESLFPELFRLHDKNHQNKYNLQDLVKIATIPVNRNTLPDNEEIREQMTDIVTFAKFLLKLINICQKAIYLNDIHREERGKEIYNNFGSFLMSNLIPKTDKSDNIKQLLDLSNLKGKCPSRSLIDGPFTFKNSNRKGRFTVNKISTRVKSVPKILLNCLNDEDKIDRLMFDDQVKDMIGIMIHTNSIDDAFNCSCDINNMLRKNHMENFDGKHTLFNINDIGSEKLEDRLEKLRKFEEYLTETGHKVILENYHKTVLDFFLLVKDYEDKVSTYYDLLKEAVSFETKAEDSTNNQLKEYYTNECKKIEDLARKQEEEAMKLRLGKIMEAEQFLIKTWNEIREKHVKNSKSGTYDNDSYDYQPVYNPKSKKLNHGCHDLIKNMETIFEGAKNIPYEPEEKNKESNPLYLTEQFQIKNGGDSHFEVSILPEYLSALNDLTAPHKLYDSNKISNIYRKLKGFLGKKAFKNS